MSNTIPVYIIQEHCEAFACWQHARRENYIAQEGNFLLHVDHHDDLACGTYQWDFTKPMQEVQTALEFTRSALGIADFITPAFYLRLFDEMLNFKALMLTPEQKKAMQIHLNGNDTLVMGPFVPLLHAGDTEKFRRFFITEAAYGTVTTQRPLVLDIDLDYFCWDDSLSTGVPARVEISRAQFEEINENPLHPLRLQARRVVYTQEEAGHWYLIVRCPEPRPKAVTREKIDARLNRFVKWLAAQEIKPAMIDICRSCISGYCPADQWEYIEQGLLQRLQEMYALRFCTAVQ